MLKCYVSGLKSDEFVGLIGILLLMEAVRLTTWDGAKTL